MPTDLTVIPPTQAGHHGAVKEQVVPALFSHEQRSLDLEAQARRLGFWARLVLIPVAVIGAVLSFDSLYKAATPTFGEHLAAGFPLLVDLLILGASLQYVAGAKVGRPMAGWRLTAHTGVVGTLILNALAATQLGDVPWHVTAPAVWAVLVELTAKQVSGAWKATHANPTDKISPTLWLIAPVESARTRLLMLRTGVTNAQLARTAVGVHAAAREALRLALPDRRGQRVRKIITRQLRAGSLPLAEILAPLGWSGSGALPDSRPETILRAVLHGVLDRTTPGDLDEQGDAEKDVASTESRLVADDADEQKLRAEEAEAQLARARELLETEQRQSTRMQSDLNAELRYLVSAAEGAAEVAADRERSLKAMIAQLTADLEQAQAERNNLGDGGRKSDYQDDAEAGKGSALQDGDEHIPDPRPSTARQSEAHRERLQTAIDFVRNHPKPNTISAPDLRIELIGQGWNVSERTALRILSAARTEAADRVPRLAAVNS